LVRAIAKSEKEVRRLKEDIDSRKWRMVADAMKNEKVCGLMNLRDSLVTDMVTSSPSSTSPRTPAANDSKSC
jgi:hypothetical protein